MADDIVVVCPSCGSDDLEGRRSGQEIDLRCLSCGTEWKRTPTASCPRCATPDPIESVFMGWQFDDNVEARDNTMAAYDDVLKALYRCTKCNHTWTVELERRPGRSES